MKIKYLVSLLLIIFLTSCIESKEVKDITFIDDFLYSGDYLYYCDEFKNEISQEEYDKYFSSKSTAKEMIEKSRRFESDDFKAIITTIISSIRNEYVISKPINDISTVHVKRFLPKAFGDIFFLFLVRDDAENLDYYTDRVNSIIAKYNSINKSNIEYSEPVEFDLQVKKDSIYKDPQLSKII